MGVKWGREVRPMPPMIAMRTEPGYWMSASRIKVESRIPRGLENDRDDYSIDE